MPRPQALESPASVVVRQLVTALSVGDAPGVKDCLSHEVTCRVPGQGRLSGEHAGKDEVIRVLGVLYGTQASDRMVQLDELLTNEIRAALLTRVWFRRGDEALSCRVIQLYEVRFGRIIDVSLWPGDQGEFERVLSRSEMPTDAATETRAGRPRR